MRAENAFLRARRMAQYELQKARSNKMKSCFVKIKSASGADVSQNISLTDSDFDSTMETSQVRSNNNSTENMDTEENPIIASASNNNNNNGNNENNNKGTKENNNNKGTKENNNNKN